MPTPEDDQPDQPDVTQPHPDRDEALFEDEHGPAFPPVREGLEDQPGD